MSKHQGAAQSAILTAIQRGTIPLGMPFRYDDARLHSVAKELTGGEGVTDNSLSAATLKLSKNAPDLIERMSAGWYRFRAAGSVAPVAKAPKVANAPAAVAQDVVEEATQAVEVEAEAVNAPAPEKPLEPMNVFTDDRFRQHEPGNFKRYGPNHHYFCGRLHVLVCFQSSIGKQFSCSKGGFLLMDEIRKRGGTVYLATARRTGGGLKTMDVTPLSPQLVEYFEHLFRNVAFTSDRGWSDYVWFDGFPKF